MEGPLKGKERAVKPQNNPSLQNLQISFTSDVAVFYGAEYIGIEYT
jgi:hypothetical protein